MAIADSFNYRRVDDFVTTSGVVEKESLRGLADEGYAAVIDLVPGDSEYAVPEERSIVEGQGVFYVNIPVDFGNPTPDDFTRFVDAMDEVAGRKVHVHCAANYRVSVFFALYARLRGAWEQGRADEFVADIWRPEDFPAWRAFIKLILSSLD